MTMAHETDTPLDSEDTVPACILVFNASDPCGAGGVTGDSLTIASVGSHPVPIVTGVYIRDTAEIFDHIALDEDAVAEQARAVLEDLSVQVIKVGFCGSPETLSTIAERKIVSPTRYVKFFEAAGPKTPGSDWLTNRPFESSTSAAAAALSAATGSFAASVGDAAAVTENRRSGCGVLDTSTVVPSGDRSSTRAGVVGKRARNPSPSYVGPWPSRYRSTASPPIASITHIHATTAKIGRAHV